MKTNKLSPTQLSVLAKLDTTWQSAYALKCRLITLNTLADAGYCDRRISKLGSITFPKTNMEFKLKNKK